MNISILAPIYDPHTLPHAGVTLQQLTLFVVWLSALFVWILRQARIKSSLVRDDRVVQLSSSSLSSAADETKFSNDGHAAETGCRQKANGSADGTMTTVKSADTPTKMLTCCSQLNGVENTSFQQQTDMNAFSPVTVSVTVDDCLKHVVQLGGLMIYIYLCDYIKVFPTGERRYDRDTCVFLFLMLVIVGCVFTMKPTQDKILNRNQTEEWKGWMQVMFVWYHYFAAKEWYNLIRVYIGCYVWMTGFGNFSFFWIRKDYSLYRVAKMLFRLDFSVLVLCAAVSNAYIVYYICAMHTYWFLSVYVTMAVFRSFNDRRLVMAAKLLAYAAFNALVFDVPSVGRYVFRPLTFVVGLQNPDVVNSTSTDQDDVLHEWLFRAGLDHWACLVGMLCAYSYPCFDSFVRRLEADQRRVPLVGVLVGDLVKSVIAVALAVVMAVWYAEFGADADRRAYVAHHPYTSTLPIVVYAVARNLWPTLRTRYVGLFAWLGKITLETYLCQLHIYLQSNAHQVIVYVAGYQLLNFAIATVIYVWLSTRLFNVTNTLSAFFLPTDGRLLVVRCSLAALVVGTSALVAAILKQLTAHGEL